MTTIHQRVRNRRVSKKRKSPRPALTGNPQRQGYVIRVFTTSPKKPNSAVRKVARLVLTNRQKITAYIPGELHTMQKNIVALVRGGNVADLPGVKYKIIRGKLDVDPVSLRRTKRSKYGLKKRRL